MFPIARSPDPESEDLIVTASSGELVPKATTVRPMTNGDNPASFASPAAPRTSASAPATRIATPTTKRENETSIGSDQWHPRTVALD